MLPRWYSTALRLMNSSAAISGLDSPAPQDQRGSLRLESMSDHYRAPGWFTRNVFNRLVAFLTGRGISVIGSRVLAVKGRTSGEWRTTPVNLLSHDGHRYL